MPRTTPSAARLNLHLYIGYAHCVGRLLILIQRMRQAEPRSPDEYSALKDRIVSKAPQSIHGACLRLTKLLRSTASIAATSSAVPRPTPRIGRRHYSSLQHGLPAF
ncbi:hypothetical protein H257_01126 [Aphanomyces astaci]|uniref:Uncharacterized protein n=1 Tax=Aphanomyces astaci TaxID=112090 RepID=W4H8M9_APHAT|nr:hypothetical protein H257_01126 [Aphanomyces astaci]ETV87619.1 hypothetical protein H257_01126 [Aphanomyces astaci]|eukprot:XP_009822482.1 hypothetical protein H257_01126 [Aphanomyces astaci]